MNVKISSNHSTQRNDNAFIIACFEDGFLRIWDLNRFTMKNNNDNDDDDDDENPLGVKTVLLPLIEKKLFNNSIPGNSIYIIISTHT
jgi:hypothetical protein